MTNENAINVLRHLIPPRTSKAAFDAFRQAIEMAIEALEEPKIIRCKNCKYWTHIKRTNRYWCKTDDGLYDLNPSPDDFCSRAERRTG